MISEQLKTYLLEQFKKRETELLLSAIEYDKKSGVRYLVQAFMSDAFVMCSVDYDLKENRFVRLSTNAENKNGKVEYIEIEL